VARKPYLVGGPLLIAGYGWSWITRAKRPVSAELMRFHRHEQMQRLMKMFRLAGRNDGGAVGALNRS
jgi:hypothetical protein